MRVLVTRALPSGEATAQRLRALGHVPILSPIRVETPLEARLPDERPDLVLLTSAAALRHAPAFPRAWAGVAFAAVGNATRSALQEAGLDARLTGGCDAKAFARAILAQFASRAMETPARLVYLAGSPRKPHIEAILSAAPGVSLVTCVCYRVERMRTLPEAARSAILDGLDLTILHFSAESARDFASLLIEGGLSRPLARLRHACLSEDVAAALQTLTGALPMLEIATEPTELALISAALACETPDRC